MSATAWRYLIPYQSDIGAAVADLKRKTFERRAFFQPYLAPEHPPVQVPRTIEDALALVGDVGTHSILDIEKMGVMPAQGVCSLLSAEVRLEVYGTLTPDRSDVDMHKFTLVNYMDSGQARFVIVHKDDEPDQIYLEGLTGN